MGIDVSATKVVTYNAAHHQRVVTDISRAPPVTELGGLKVVSIFQRRAVRRDKTDGNPLIYALKGKFGYTMPYASFRGILECASAILPVALAGMQYDVVVPLPSSSKVAGIFAKRAARAHGNCPIVACFEKTNYAQALASAAPVAEVEERHRRDYKAQLNQLQRANPQHLFEMKHVKLALRPYFTPLVANSLAARLTGAHILFVDDILGSGASLAAADSALQPFGPAGTVGLTIMSPLG